MGLPHILPIDAKASKQNPQGGIQGSGLQVVDEKEGEEEEEVEVEMVC